MVDPLFWSCLVGTVIALLCLFVGYGIGLQQGRIIGYKNAIVAQRLREFTQDRVNDMMRGGA